MSQKREHKAARTRMRALVPHLAAVSTANTRPQHMHLASIACAHVQHKSHVPERARRAPLRSSHT